MAWRVKTEQQRAGLGAGSNDQHVPKGKKKKREKMDDETREEAK